MEIKTNIELLNEISAKLGGKSDASVLVEGLNNIANALGDTDPDQMVTVSQALETVLDHMDGGGGGSSLKGKIKVKIVNNSTSPIMPYAVNQELPLFALLIDGGIYNSTFDFESSIILPNSEAYVDYICIGNLNGDVIEWKVHTNKMVLGQASVQTKTITELVNCVADGLDQIEITDPTIEASCTIEYEDTGN